MRRVELKDPPVTIFGRDYATYGTLTKIVFLCKLISWLLCIDEARRSVRSTFYTYITNSLDCATQTCHQSLLTGIDRC